MEVDTSTIQYQGLDTLWNIDLKEQSLRFLADFDGLVSSPIRVYCGVQCKPKRAMDRALRDTHRDGGFGR